MREAGGLCVRVCANASLRTLCGFVRSRACLCALESVYLHLFVEVFLCVCVCVCRRGVDGNVVYVFLCKAIMLT